MALRAVRDSKGLLETVTDMEILEAQRLLASLEGLFVEPASASAIAGLKKLVEEDRVEKNESIVCITTGHGLKDPSIIAEKLPKPLKVGDDFDQIVKALGLR
jgi:threonine synthase